MDFHVSVEGDFSAKRIRHILDLNANPRTRAVAARHINHGTRTVIGYAQEIAAAELKNDRPEERRRTSGKHYIDSFVVLPNTVDSIGRMVGGFRNTHPAANIIEHGARPHEIHATNAPDLIFPHTRDSSRGGPRKSPGSWPVTGGDELFVGPVARHPGTPAYRIVKRARDRYRSTLRGSHH